MTVEYDKDLEILYIRLNEGKCAFSEDINKNVIIDLDVDGHILAIEILDVYIHAVKQNSAKHREARNLIGSFLKIHLSIIVIYEIVWALRKVGLNGEKINEVLESKF